VQTPEDNIYHLINRPEPEFRFGDQVGELTEAIGQGSFQTPTDSRSSMRGKRLAGFVGLLIS
jgi:hypothetical protein